MYLIQIRTVVNCLLDLAEVYDFFVPSHSVQSLVSFCIENTLSSSSTHLDPLPYPRLNRGPSQKPSRRKYEYEHNSLILS